MIRHRARQAFGAWRNRGVDVICPVCGCQFARFQPDWNRSNALCCRCGSSERHRALWVFLDQRPELFEEVTSLLHFAPESFVEERLRRSLPRGGGVPVR